MQSAMTSKLPLRGMCRGETRSDLALRSSLTVVRGMDWNGQEVRLDWSGRWLLQQLR